MTKSNLNEGAIRMGRIVRAARERQRALSGFEDMPLSAMNPADAWARKYLSEGIGPDMPQDTFKTIAQAPAHELPALGRQAQFMRELKARAAKPERTMTSAPVAKTMTAAPSRTAVAAAAPGKIAMERPFVPSSQRRRGK